jgi:hypothetical protein
MGTKKTISVKERIRRGGPPTKTVRVWLGADLDLVEQYEAAERELEAAQAPADSLAGNGSTADISARLDALRAQLDEFAFDFRLRGMDYKRWQRLTAEHPPRKAEDGSVDPQDRVGWNSETFPLALVRAATVAPELDDEDWLALLGDDVTEGSLSSAQLDELAAVAFSLSKAPVDIPFSRAASLTRSSSASE